ncbi:MULTISPECIES: hypothetical protein [Bacteria]|uniref:hypothetical protein n=1 Tax=Bacteria TaxID=2 RepID=UPI003C7CFF8E
MKRSLALASVALAGALALAGCSAPSVTPPSGGKPAASPAAEKPAAEAKSGTRENPAALGSTITGKDWTVVVNSVNLDAQQTVAEANQFNQPAPEGSQYITVNYTVTYTGDDANGATPALVGVDYVTAGGQTVDRTKAIAVLPDSMPIDVIYKGASASGSVAIAVPSVDIDKGVLAIRPGMVPDKVFVAVK